MITDWRNEVITTTYERVLNLLGDSDVRFSFDIKEKCLPENMSDGWLSIYEYEDGINAEYDGSNLEFLKVELIRLCDDVTKIQWTYEVWMLSEWNFLIEGIEDNWIKVEIQGSLSEFKNKDKEYSIVSKEYENYRKALKTELHKRLEE